MAKRRDRSRALVRKVRKAIDEFSVKISEVFEEVASETEDDAVNLAVAAELIRELVGWTYDAAVSESQLHESRERLQHRIAALLPALCRQEAERTEAAADYPEDAPGLTEERVFVDCVRSTVRAHIQAQRWPYSLLSEDATPVEQLSAAITTAITLVDLACEAGEAYE